jgi:hypothetical protein
MEEGYGFLSLLPPLVAITLCFITKRVLVSLFLGVFYRRPDHDSGNPLGELPMPLIRSWLHADEWNARLLIFNLLMGAGFLSFGDLVVVRP